MRRNPKRPSAKERSMTMAEPKTKKPEAKSPVAMMQQANIPVPTDGINCVERAPLEAAASKAEAIAFGSPLAARLVQTVPEPDRVPLLGDLLAALYDFAPEAQQNEAAEETVRRLTVEVTRLREQVNALGTQVQESAMREKEALGQVEAIRASALARRSPETALVSRFAFLRRLLAEAGLPTEEGKEEQAVGLALSERHALREVFANTAKPCRLAVLRDDSADGVAERFTLLLGEVKGGALSLTPLGSKASAWIDLRPMVETQVVPFLTPVEFGGRR